MLKKIWKLIVFVGITILTEIIIHTTDSVLDSDTTLQTATNFRNKLFSQNYSLFVMILFMLSAFFLGAFIQDLLFNKSEKKSKEDKKFLKQKKSFEKRKNKFFQIDGFDVYYDVTYMEDATPHAYNLKFYSHLDHNFYEAHNKPYLYNNFNEVVVDVNHVKHQINTYLQQLWHGII